MAGFRVFVSNRLEALADCLAELIESKPLSSPLVREQIVVQSKGMERWLSIRLAQRFGIWGNCCYPFPNKIIYDLIRLVVPNMPDQDLFEPRILTWRLAKHLSACRLRPGFESLRNYLTPEEGEDSGRGQKEACLTLRQLQLARRLTDTFDRYLMFRPQWVLAWERGEEIKDRGKDAHWQAELWRELVKEIAASQPATEADQAWAAHKAAILQKFLDRISELSPDELPSGQAFERICIFGIPSLPPLHLKVFYAISKFLDVNLFLINPCQEYWFDIASDKDLVRVHKKFASHAHPLTQTSPEKATEPTPAGMSSEEELHFETGHPLLASLGKHAAHFFDTLFDLPLIEEESRFEDPGEGSLLCCLQSDILFLQDRGRQKEKKIIAADDDSIQIHVCHSPMREVEVLYDCLLDLFNRKPDLEPRDIIVMTPEIETYAPYIEAVFATCQDPSRKIPYSIADRSARREGQLVEAFLNILDLCRSRFGQSQVLDILETPCIQRRFDLDGEGIMCVRRWVDETRIRWGVDAESRKRWGVPDFQENTWRAGLDRLLLGYALPATEDKRIFAEILPYDSIEGEEAAILGRFLEFIDQLFNQTKELEQPRSLAEWAASLKQLMDRLFQPDETEEIQQEAIQEVLQELREIQQKANFEDKVSLETIKAYLADRLENKKPAYGFLSGGVTFCTLLPMRSIPHRVVALLGMGDGLFPRTARPAGFDLMAKEPRKGDPSKRDEDLYLFLEAILCAREHLLISYVGQSIRDNSQIPPSVVVSELIEAIERGFEHPQGNILDRIITIHRLQAFSPAYFQPDGPLFSFCQENLNALLTRSRNSSQHTLSQDQDNKPKEETKTKRPPFILLPLPYTWGGERKTVSLSQLIQFLANPAKFFLISRLGIRLDDSLLALNEREPFEICGLDRYQIEQELVQRKLREEDLEDHQATVRSRGMLPHGTMGKIAYQDLCTTAARLAVIVLRYTQGAKEMPPLDVDTELAGFHLTGKICGLWPKGLIRYRCATIKPQDWLRVWIEHLVLNFLPEGTHHPRESLLIGSDGQWYLPPIPDSEKILERILNYYQQGMSFPLPFFPATSFEYTERIITKGQAEAEARQMARKMWEGNNFRSGEKGERENPYLRLCFGQTDDPLNQDFATLSQDIYGPILRYRRQD